MPMTELVRLGGGKVKITLETADGARDFICRPLTLHDLVEFEAEFGDLTEAMAGNKRIAAIEFLVWRILWHHNKDLTREQVGDLFTMDDMAEGKGCEPDGAAIRLLNLFMGGGEEDPKVDAPAAPTDPAGSGAS